MRLRRTGPWTTWTKRNIVNDPSWKFRNITSYLLLYLWPAALIIAAWTLGVRGTNHGSGARSTLGFMEG
jgi:hypothetical protein